MSGPANAESNGVKLPPDPYVDVYLGALCKGLFGSFDVSLCSGCPVRERCNAMYEDLQFGSLSYCPGEEGRLDGILTGPWGGHLYEKVGPNTRFMRDGKQWLVEDRPVRRAWA